MKSTPLLDYNSAFRALTRLIDVGVLIVTPDRTLDFISDRARELLNCSSDEDETACWSNVKSAVEPLIEKAETTEHNPVRDSTDIALNGHPNEVRFEVHAILDDADEHTGYLVLLKDHDNFRRIEQSLRLAMQMHHTGRLYEALAHDLRQPIGAILVHLKILEEINKRVVRDGPHKGKYEESIATIRDEVKELDQSLQLLLHELSPSDDEEVIHLEEVIQSVARLIEPQVQKEGLTLETDIADELLTVLGRRFRIKQAILNLATNALEAMTSGTLTLRLYARDGQACIEVADEGCGIPEDMQRRMFERHYTTKEDGTGLGLYIVKQTIQSHGGHINVDSTPGEGTTFQLYLPMAAAKSTDGAAEVVS